MAKKIQRIKMLFNARHLPKLDGVNAWFELCEDKQKSIGSVLEGDYEADFAVLGAGICGFASAYFLAQKFPKAKIALVEALKIGQGASSRNAGFIIDLPHNVDEGEPTPERDGKIYALNCFAIEFLRDFVEKNSIKCDWQKAGKYMGARDNLQGLDAFEKHLKPCGFEFKRLNSSESAKKLGTNYYKEAIFTPNNILMNPSALMRGLVANLPKNVAIFESSPIKALENGNTKVLIGEKGRVKAGVLVLALDSFLEEFSLAKRHHAALFTYASMSEVLNDSEIEQIFKDAKPFGLTSAHPAGTTIRLTPDKRVFVRNVLDYQGSISCSQGDLSRAVSQHRRSFEARYPALKHKNFEFSWGGSLSMTLNSANVLYEIAPNIYGIGATNGVGMAKGVYMGRAVAELINKEENENLAFILANATPSYMPPDPLRSIGAKIRLWWEQHNAKGDV